MVPGGVRPPRRAAADRQRQARPPRPARPGGASGPSWPRPTPRRATPTEETLAAGLGARCCGVDRVGVARQLLRPRRRLDPQHSRLLRPGREAGAGVSTCQQLFQHPTIAELARAGLGWRPTRRQQAHRAVRAGRRRTTAAGCRTGSRTPIRSPACRPACSSTAAERRDGRLPQRLQLPPARRRSMPRPLPQAFAAGCGPPPRAAHLLRPGAFSEPLQLVHRHAEPCRSRRRTCAADRRGAGAALARWSRPSSAPCLRPGAPPLAARSASTGRERTASSFAWTLHHAILDGWSLASLLTELFQLYSRPVAGRAAADAGARRRLPRLRGGRARGARVAGDPARTGSGRLAGRHAPAGWPRPRRSASGRGRTAASCRSPLTGVGVTRVLELAAAGRRAAQERAPRRPPAAVLRLLAGEADARDRPRPATAAPRRSGGERGLRPVPQHPAAALAAARRHLARAGAGGLRGRARDAAAPALPLAELQRQREATALFETLFNFTHFHVSGGGRAAPVSRWSA